MTLLPLSDDEATLAAARLQRPRKAAPHPRRPQVPAPAQVAGDVVETDSADNGATATVTVTVAAETATGGGGGCSAADGQRPVDPMLPLLAALGLLGWGLRRARRH